MSEREHAVGVLPSWLLPPAVAAALWVALSPFWLADVTGLDAALTGALPGGVAVVFGIVDYALWRRRDRPWHDWAVIVLLLPPIASGVWAAIGGLILDLGLSRAELLGLEVGPGVALTGLFTTTISYHGRHYPEATA
jgi:hypothetical protein